MQVQIQGDSLIFTGPEGMQVTVPLHARYGESAPREHPQREHLDWARIFVPVQESDPTGQVLNFSNLADGALVVAYHHRPAITIYMPFAVAMTALNAILDRVEA